MSIGEQIRDAILAQGVEVRSGFGDTVTVPMRADLALYSQRAEDPRVFRQFLASGGAISIATAEATLSTGVSAGASATMLSVRHIRYQPGFGSRVRIAGRFPFGGVEDSIQLLGAFTSEDGLMIGFSGEQFGVFHRLDRALEIQKLTVTAGAAGAETATITLAGTGHAVPLTLNTSSATDEAHAAAEIAAFSPYADATATYLAYNYGETVYFVRQAHGDPPAGAYSMSSTGTAAGAFTQSQDGADGTQLFAPIGLPVGTMTSQFETLDPLDGSGPSKIVLDPTVGNVYSIDFGWLGYSGATFLLKQPRGEGFVPFYRLNWANTSFADRVLLRDPRLTIGASIASLGSTTDIQMAAGSMFGGVAGDVIVGPQWARTAESINIGTTEVAICGVQNAAVLFDLINRRRLNIRSVIVTNFGVKTAIVRLRADPDLTLPLWVQADPNSIVLDDTSNTPVSGGTLIRALPVAPGETIELDFIADPLRLDRTQILSITAQTSSSTTSVVVIVQGNEDQ
jgi:hypothetical protein